MIQAVSGLKAVAAQLLRQRLALKVRFPGRTTKALQPSTRKYSRPERQRGLKGGFGKAVRDRSEVRGPKGPMGSSPWATAFGQFRIDGADLKLDYVGLDTSADFSINTNGELTVTVTE